MKGYEATFTILKLEFNRNVEEHQLPIDCVEVDFLANIIEIVEKSRKLPRHSNYYDHQDRMSKISSALSSKKASFEAGRDSKDASTSSEGKWTDSLNDNVEAAMKVINETVKEAEDILDESADEKSEEYFDVVENASSGSIESVKIEPNDEIENKLHKKASKASVKFAINDDNEASTSKNKAQEVQDTYLGTIDEESEDDLIQNEKRMAMIPIFRTFKAFGSNGAHFSTKPQNLTNFLERKPIQYRLYKDGEVIGNFCDCF